MSRENAAVIVIAVLVLLVALMALGWYLRRRSQRGIPTMESVPADLGAELATADGLYVSTTYAGRPLERVAVHGLGFRARAGVGVHAGGILLALPGSSDRWIPASVIRGVERATVTIDRVVEPGGLVKLAWTLGDTDVDSYFRVDDQPALIAAISSIVPKFPIDPQTPALPTPEGAA